MKIRLAGTLPPLIAHPPLRLRHRAARSRDKKPGGEGGDPPRHRSRDTRQIGGEMRALGLLLPYAVEGTKIHTEYTAFLCVSTAGPELPLRSDCARFFAYSALIIDFKGLPMKLKIVALALSVE